MLLLVDHIFAPDLYDPFMVVAIIYSYLILSLLLVFFLFFWCDQKYLILFVIDCCTHSEPIKILSQHNLLLMCLCCSAKKNSLELSYSFFFLIVKKEMAKEIEGE